LDGDAQVLGFARTLVLAAYAAIVTFGVSRIMFWLLSKLTGIYSHPLMIGALSLFACFAIQLAAGQSHNAPLICFHLVRTDHLDTAGFLPR